MSFLLEEHLAKAIEERERLTKILVRVKGLADILYAAGASSDELFGPSVREVGGQIVDLVNEAVVGRPILD